MAMASVPAASPTAAPVVAAASARVVCVLRTTIKRRPWTGDEDARLQRLAKEHGFHSWRRVASHLPGRSTKECRDRWRHCLARDVYHRPFTASDDDELVRLYVRHAGCWTDMSRAVYARTSRLLRHRWREIRYTSAVLGKFWRPRPPPNDQDALAGRDGGAAVRSHRLLAS
ncbi:hypothetical protein BS78_03G059900 [Paspalum vaginatum]|nr:hypothetical protein BS78_03G059900 [Paspalum vaginatum]